MNAHASILRDFGMELQSETPEQPPASPSDAEIELMLARARGQARSEGYARGIEDAEAGFDREVLLRLETAAGALSALAEQRDSARADLAESCRGILSAFLEAVAPRLAEINLVPELVATVDEAVASAPGAHVLVEVAPEQVDDMTERLAAHDDLCRILAAADLSAAEARVSWRGGFDLIDVRPAIQRALEILDARLVQAASGPETPANEETLP